MRAYILIHTSLREELQQLELTERAEAEEGVLEWQDLLDSDLSVGGLVECSDDGTVRAFAEAVEELIVITLKGEPKLETCQ